MITKGGIGPQLARRYTDARLTRNEVAKAVGVAPSVVYHWIAGDCEPQGIYKERLFLLFPGLDYSLPKRSADYMRVEIEGYLRQLSALELTAVGDYLRVAYLDKLNKCKAQLRRDYEH